MNEIEEVNKMEKFLEDMVGEKSRVSYRCHLKKFFEAIDKRPDDYVKVDVRKLTNGKKIDITDKCEADILKFAESIKNTPPKSQIVRLSVVKKFFKYLKMDFYDLWDNIRKKNGLTSAKAITPKKTPTVDDLHYILDLSPEVCHKALFLLCASSGLRIGEVVEIRMDDIDIPNRIIYVRDTITKKGYSRKTSFTPEAQEYLEKWLEVREKYIKSKSVKSKYVRESEKTGKVIEDNRVFPMVVDTAVNKWKTLLERAGSPYNDKFEDKRLKDSRYMLNEHCLRRFFKSHLRTAGMRKDYIDYMIGHQNINDATYTDDNLFFKKVKGEYDKYTSSITIFSDAEKTKSVLEPKINRQDNLIAHQRNQIEALQLEVKEMQGKIKDDAEEYFGGLDIHYKLEERDNRIKELEMKLESVIEAVKKMGQ